MIQYLLKYNSISKNNLKLIYEKLILDYYNNEVSDKKLNFSILLLQVLYIIK